MHTLFILTAVLSTLAPDTTPAPQSPPITPDASEHSRLEAPPSTTPPGPSIDKYHLLEEQAREASTPNVGGRIALETLAGIGMGAGGALLGSVVVSGSLNSVPQLALIPLSLLLLGSTVGVTWAGSAMQGHGDFNFTLLGGVAGYVVPIAIAIAAIPSVCPYGTGCQSALLLLGATALVVPTLGAIVGYELSSAGASTSPGHASRSRPPAPRVVPVLAPASQGIGATVGVAGML